eukprot:CCRYP_017965-RA/>CCRYP_017965-RA protein AED:0.82 eAED:0.65 QI:0/0/0/0.5/1/1/2/0/253
MTLEEDIRDEMIDSHLMETNNLETIQLAEKEVDILHQSHCFLHTETFHPNVILDDRPSAAKPGTPLFDRFVLTQTKLGLTEQDVDKSLLVLSEKYPRNEENHDNFDAASSPLSSCALSEAEGRIDADTHVVAESLTALSDLGEFNISFKTCIPSFVNVVLIPYTATAANPHHHNHLEALVTLCCTWDVILLAAFVVDSVRTLVAKVAALDVDCVTDSNASFVLFDMDLDLFSGVVFADGGNLLMKGSENLGIF